MTEKAIEIHCVAGVSRRCAHSGKLCPAPSENSAYARITVISLLRNSVRGILVGNKMASEGQTAEEGGDGAPSPWRVTGNASALSDDIQRAVVAMKGALAPHFGASDAASVPQIVAQYALFARSEHARRAGAPEEPGAAALLPEGVRVGGWAGMFRPTFCCSEAVAAEERTYLQALYWGLRAPCTLTRRFVPLGNADGAGGQFVLWLPEEALEGHDWDPEAPGVAPVVYLGSEGETSVVAASFRGFVAWQCAPPGLDMDSFRLYAAVADAEEEEDEEEEGDPEARARFLEWAAVCGVHAIPDMATAAAYTLWSREVCAQVAHFAVDIAVAEASETAASVAAPARAAAEEFFASDCRSSVDECVTFTTALGAAAGRIFQQADKLGYDLMCKTLAVGGMSPDVDAIGGEPLLAAVAADGRLQTVRFLIGADANVNRQSGGLFGWVSSGNAIA